MVPVVGDLDVGINAKGNDLHLETDITAAKSQQTSYLHSIFHKRYSFAFRNLRR